MQNNSARMSYRYISKRLAPGSEIKSIWTKLAIVSTATDKFFFDVVSVLFINNFVRCSAYRRQSSDHLPQQARKIMFVQIEIHANALQALEFDFQITMVNYYKFVLCYGS